MPAGKSFTPRAFPFHLSCFIGRAEFPQGKISRVALLSFIHSCAFLQTFNIQTCQITVFGIAAGIKVHAITGDVGHLFGFNLLDSGNLFCDMVGCFANNGRRFYVEQLEIIKKCLSINVCNFPGSFTGAGSTFFHFVFTVICV